MTEQDVILWIKTNWPSVGIALIFIKVYLQLHRFVNRIELNETRLSNVEARVDTIQDVCSDVHPENGKKLFQVARVKNKNE